MSTCMRAGCIRETIRATRTSDREELTDDVAVDVGEAVVAAAVAIGQSLMIESHHVQDCRVQVVDVDLVLHGMPAEFVGRAVDMAGADPASGHPHRETK